MTYALFGRVANRYDWHTPPHHYQDDHAFVLARLGMPPRRVLDVGCGTGVFLEKALTAGFDVVGLDAAPEMVAIASQRVGRDRVRLGRMQDLAETASYDVIVSLNWSFNYVRSFREAKQLLRRFKDALRPSGQLILQVAHAPNATEQLNEDREPGPEGEPNDVLFLYRFRKGSNPQSELRAQYVYGCKSRGELVFEEHALRATDARALAAHAAANGFEDVELFDSWRGEPLGKSISAFLVAITPSSAWRGEK